MIWIQRREFIRLLGGGGGLAAGGARAGDAGGRSVAKRAADVSGAAPRLLRRCDACLIDDRREALTLAAHISSETFAAEPARLDAERGQPHLDLRLLADR